VATRYYRITESYVFMAKGPGCPVAMAAMLPKSCRYQEVKDVAVAWSGEVEMEDLDFVAGGTLARMPALRGYYGPAKGRCDRAKGRGRQVRGWWPEEQEGWRGGGPAESVERLASRFGRRVAWPRRSRKRKRQRK